MLEIPQIRKLCLPFKSLILAMKAHISSSAMHVHRCRRGFHNVCLMGLSGFFYDCFRFFCLLCCLITAILPPIRSLTTTTSPTNTRIRTRNGWPPLSNLSGAAAANLLCSDVFQASTASFCSVPSMGEWELDAHACFHFLLKVWK